MKLLLDLDMDLLPTSGLAKADARVISTRHRAVVLLEAAILMISAR